MLAPVLVLLQPKGSLRTPAKSARDLLRASFDEKMLGKHPKALYLNRSEVGHVIPEALDENKEKPLWEGSLRHADVKEGETVLRDWK
jgi:hypothetical protein